MAKYDLPFLGRIFKSAKPAFALAILIGSSAASAAGAHAGPRHDPRAEVIQQLRSVERMFNSEAFTRNRHIMFEDMDPGPNFRLFDITEPMEMRGDVARNFMYEITGQFIARVEFLNIDVQASGDVAFASYIQHVVGADPAGHPLDVSIRTTDGLRKINGRWLIVHEHNSLALDNATLGALMARRSPGSAPSH